MNLNTTRRKAFKKKWITYDLSHLHPFSLPIKINHKWLLRKKIMIQVVFSSHCFTSKFDSKKHSIDDKYNQCNEWRYFCLERYDLSKKYLKDIIRSFSDLCIKNKVFFSNNADFFKLNLLELWDYYVFFTLKKSKINNNDLLMIITSAHLRDDNLYHKQPDINLKALLIWVFTNKKIKKAL